MSGSTTHFFAALHRAGIKRSELFNGTPEDNAREGRLNQAVHEEVQAAIAAAISPSPAPDVKGLVERGTILAKRIVDGYRDLNPKHGAETIWLEANIVLAIEECVEEAVLTRQPASGGPSSDRAIREAVIEECARIADRQIAHNPGVIGNRDERITHRHCAMDIAAAIRALKSGSGS